MDEKKLETVALVYWTRERNKILDWIDLAAMLNLKFYVTAYNEASYTKSLVYQFRLDPVPDEKKQKYLEDHGFEHRYRILKEEY